MIRIYKYLILSLVAIAFAIPMTASALDPKYQTVKIGVHYGNNAKSSVEITSESGFNAGYMDGSNFVSLYSFAETYFNVAPTSDPATISINGTHYYVSGGNFAFSPINGIVNINGSAYRGGVEFIPDSKGKLTVINFVNINDYIAGVVGKEMSPSWPIEALKAQAVCARTYTLTTWNKHSHQGFNLCGTQDCQAYLGMSGESESTRRAASETLDQVAVYGSKIIETLYSSSHGGSSAYSKYVWGSDLPYLVAVTDNFEEGTGNPNDTWTVTVTKSDIESKLSAKSINIGPVVDMKVTGADEYGRTFEVTIYGTNGTHVLKNDTTRTFFGLKSQKYSITPSNGAMQGPAFPAESIGIKPDSQHKASATFLEAMKILRSRTDGSAIWEGTITTPALPQASQSPSDHYTLTGHGWGHGLGMSQYGAKGMATLGYSYVDIIEHYYKGATVN